MSVSKASALCTLILPVPGKRRPYPVLCEDSAIKEATHLPVDIHIIPRTPTPQ